MNTNDAEYFGRFVDATTAGINNKIHDLVADNWRFRVSDITSVVDISGDQVENIVH